MAATAEIRSVTLDKLTPDPDQVRKNFDKASIATLAANIKARGILVPLRARQLGKKLVIVDGERRYRAAKVAKLNAVPVIVVDDSDDVQRSLDQVAMNSLREPLKPLELGRLLVSLRKDHKLSDNQIAAHLDKQGIPALSKGQMKELMQLLDLPEWAAEMIDEGQLEPAAAGTILYTARDPKVLKALQRSIERDAKMGGRVPTREVERDAAYAYDSLGEADLTKTGEYYQDPVRFNPAVACKGCEHFRAIDHVKVCMNRKHFDELQAAAKEAGLGPGGKKPSPQKKGAETRAENEQAERRTEAKMASKAERLTKLVHRILQDYLVDRHVATSQVLADKLMLWLAANQPDGRRYGRQWFSHGATNSRAVEELVETSPLTSLGAFLENPAKDLSALSSALGCAAVRVMSWSQVQALAMHLEVDIAKVFTVGDDYLALQSLDQLKELGRLAGIEKANTMTGKALKSALLYSPEAIFKLGVPADVMQVYSDVPEIDDDGYADVDLDEHEETLEDEDDTGEDTPIEEQEEEAA